MKVFAGMHIHNCDKWIGYAIASVYHAVDHILVGITRQSNDRTRHIVEELRNIDPKKITIYDNDRTDMTKGGFGAVKTEMIKRCGSMGADWILNLDADHIYYPMGNKLRELVNNAPSTAIKFRQYFLYKGFRTISLDPKENPKADKKGYSMFASLFKYTPKARCDGEVHETVKGVGDWYMHKDLPFVHIGPIMDDWAAIEKEYFYSGMKKEGLEEPVNKKPFNEWLKNLQSIKTPNGPNETFYPKNLIDFVAKRRAEKLVPFENVRPGGLPAVMEYYYNGSHDLDIEWLKEYIRRKT